MLTEEKKAESNRTLSFPLALAHGRSKEFATFFFFYKDPLEHLASAHSNHMAPNSTEIIRRSGFKQKRESQNRFLNFGDAGLRFVPPDSIQ
jgi:hypothetical protein